MCELTGDKMNSATSEPREWWMVVGVKDKDKEIFPTRALAEALALVNNFRYAGLGPYRVLHVMEDDMKGNSYDDQSATEEVRERETLTERRAEEAERQTRAESEVTP